MNQNTLPEMETSSRQLDLEGLTIGTLAVAFGVLLAVTILPGWLPAMTASAVGEAPQVYWFLSRGMAFVGFILLWASMALGLLITNRLARAWPGGPMAVDLHQYTSLIGLAFSMLHALTLTGDRYLQLSVTQALTPFRVNQYLPFWVGVGQRVFTPGQSWLAVFICANGLAQKPGV